MISVVLNEKERLAINFLKDSTYTRHMLSCSSSLSSLANVSTKLYVIERVWRDLWHFFLRPIRMWDGLRLTSWPSYTFCKHNGDRSKTCCYRRDLVRFPYINGSNDFGYLILLLFKKTCVRRLLQFTLAYHTLFGSKTAASQKTALEKFRTQYLFTSQEKTITLELYICCVHAREDYSLLIIVRSSFWKENSGHLKSPFGQFWMWLYSISIKLLTLFYTFLRGS